jgi:hypothetical protein
MADFYSGVYYPVRAFLSGGNPHNRDWFLATYPLVDGYPPYLPINLLVHLPFGLLPPGPAAVAYFALNVLLTLLLAYLSLRLVGVATGGTAVVWLAAGILLTRPGHWNLILGQRAAELAVATYAALYFAGRTPVASAVALTLSLIKPTYGLPLALLMFARGFRREAGLGLGLGALVNLPLILLLSAREGGLGAFVATLLKGYHAWQGVGDVSPASSNVRVDATSTLSRLLGHPLPDTAQLGVTLGILVLAALVLRPRAANGVAEGDSTTVGIICLAVLLTGHHVGYDCLLLVAPCVALLLRPADRPEGRPQARWLFIALFAVPALNWASTQSVLEAWRPSPMSWLIVTSVNGVCVALLFALYLWQGVRDARRPPPPVGTPPFRTPAVAAPRQ